MKKYVVFMKDEEESWKVQEALFSVGFKWQGSGGASFVDTRGQFLQLNHYGDTGTIHYANSFGFIIKSSGDGGHIGLTGYEVIANPSQLDGAKEPEEMITVAGKEYSESTLISALRQYVG